MNKIINQYLIINFLKVIMNAVLIFFSLGIVLNLLEEIEFFKNLDQSFTLPLILSLSFVPTLIIDLLPFIVFLSSMFYFLRLKSNKDLLSVKIFGYSNAKVVMIMAFFSFIFGFFVLFVINPVTSTLVKYYEVEKARHSLDVDHLISVNKNGVWIKENDDTGYKIINAKTLDNQTLKKISIYFFDENHNVIKRIQSESAIITKNPWIMKNVFIYDIKNNKDYNLDSYNFYTDKILDKINSLYRNLNTISFLNLIKNYDQLKKIGYSEKILVEQIHRFVSLPFFLFLMVVLASIFSIGSKKSKQNYYYILLSILVSVVIFYFKDLSIALGETGKISLVLSVWMPIMVISLFCLIGVIQINEK
mgnify:CR=1 FL=1